MVDVHEVVQLRSDFFPLEDMADVYLRRIVSDLKDRASNSVFVQSQKAESEKLRVVNEIVHEALPKLVDMLRQHSADEHHMDVVIAEAFKDADTQG